ncbi:MAG: hypothetical protein ABI183_22890 [Polyangiaceae bacterium]
MGDGDGDDKRRRLEGVIPELIRRAVVAGVEKATEAPDSIKHLVGDLKLPKEIAHYLFAQVDETKNGLFRVVAKEMRDFLEHTNLSGEMTKMLTSLKFEVSTTIRFRPNDGASSGKEEDEDGPATLPKPEVKTDVVVKRERRRRRTDKEPE